MRVLCWGQQQDHWRLKVVGTCRPGGIPGTHSTPQYSTVQYSTLKFLSLILVPNFDLQSLTLSVLNIYISNTSVWELFCSRRNTHSHLFIHSGRARCGRRMWIDDFVWDKLRKQSQRSSKEKIWGSFFCWKFTIENLTIFREELRIPLNQLRRHSSYNSSYEIKS